MNDLKSLKSSELLALHAQVGDELRERGIMRSSNNPTADLAEYLFCRAFDWTQANNSHPAADATCGAGMLYQIKGRRLSKADTSRQLSALRKLSDGGFHYLAGVLFAPDYTIMRAAIIPHAQVLANSSYVKHTNSWRFMLHDRTWTWPDVRDVTQQLRSVTF